MEIVQQEQAYFLRNIPTIQVRQVSGKADVSVYLDGMNRLSESYTPDGSANVYIHGLADFVADYVDLGEIPTLANWSNVFAGYLRSLSVRVSDAGDSDDLQAWVYPCRQKCSLGPAALRFLNRQRVRTVCDEPFYFNYVGKGCYVKFTSYYPTGSARGNANSRTTNFEDLVSFCVRKKNYAYNIYQLKVELFNQSDVLVDTFLIQFEESNRFSKAFVFDNVFYAPESIAFRGSEKENEVVEAEYGYIDGKYKRLVNKSIKEYVINSGPLNQAEYESACDIIEAQHVYYVDGDELVPIVVTNFETEHKDPNDNPYFVTMTYRLSDRARMKIQDVENIGGIFTSPFNPVFD